MVKMGVPRSRSFSQIQVIFPSQRKSSVLNPPSKSRRFPEKLAEAAITTSKVLFYRRRFRVSWKLRQVWEVGGKWAEKDLGKMAVLQ